MASRASSSAIGFWCAGGATSPALAARYPGWGVVIDLHKQATLLAKHASHVRMFLWEGGFFLLMVFLGGVMIWRSMQREVMLIRQQANFLSAVTHELKSPLASLRLFIQTMQMRDLSAAKRAQYLGDMRNDVDRLDALVGNLLAVARLDAGAFVVQPEIMELNQDVGQLVAGLREPLASRQASLQFCPSPRPLPVRLDAQALQTLVRNLVDNAVKYGGPQAAVSVHLWHRPPNAVLEVRDRGLGIAAVEQAKIFDKFYRVGDELVRQSEGSGLGLYLVRALMQSHGGEVQVESAGLGEGASFSLRLPLATPAAVG